MAFSSTLNLGGKEYDVLDCKYSLRRDVDSKGRPASNIYGGRITVRVESTADTTILEHMVINLNHSQEVSSSKKEMRKLK